MISTSTTETITFKPPWRESDPAAPVFHLRAAGVIERGAMEAELAGEHLAGKVHGYELRAAIREGVETLLADDAELGRVLELIDAEDGQELSDADKQLLEEVRRVLAEHYPPYRGLLLQLERRKEIAPIVALRRFCTNIEAPGVVFTKGKDGMVAESTLAALDPLEMNIAGNRAYALAYGYGEDTEKNSARPSSSDDGQKTSDSGSASKAVGRSRAKSGSKTPA